MDGKVKFFNQMKGYGFISGADGKDYFVHQSSIPEGANLKEGTEVTFVVVQGDRGEKADKVALKK